MRGRGGRAARWLGWFGLSAWRTLPTWQFSEQNVNGGLPVVETSHAPVTAVVPAGATGQVVPLHEGRQHSWVESGKWTGLSPDAQPAPPLPGFSQCWPPGPGGPGGGGGGAGPAQVKPQMPEAQ